jgi:hypothetical protein
VVLLLWRRDDSIPPDTPHAGLLRFARGGVGRIPPQVYCQGGSAGFSGLSWTLAIQRQFEEPTHVTVISREFRNRERCEALTRNKQPIKINAALSYPILSYVQKYTRKMIDQALRENIECYCTQSPSYQAVRPLQDRDRGHQCINPSLIRSLNTRSTSISCRSPSSEH